MEQVNPARLGEIVTFYIHRYLTGGNVENGFVVEVIPQAAQPDGSQHGYAIALGGRHFNVVAGERTT
ncbi:hypothetical protein AB0O20_36790 [Streptomyces kronopolitis]|uniref:hypothetical protein n=1 Tax=Streptomyces kronopolitis TaxID=1612435 RepID=UPI00341443D1